MDKFMVESGVRFQQPTVGLDQLGDSSHNRIFYSRPIFSSNSLLFFGYILPSNIQCDTHA